MNRKMALSDFDYGNIENNPFIDEGKPRPRKIAISKEALWKAKMAQKTRKKLEFERAARESQRYYKRPEDWTDEDIAAAERELFPQKGVV